MPETVSIKGYITSAPDATAFVSADTRREWEPYPVIKGYITSAPDPNKFIKGNTVRVIGSEIGQVTNTYSFEQLAPAVLGPFRFEGIQSSIDNENTYTLEIKVLEPPRPGPVPPIVTEPIIVSGKYEEVLNPYANTDPIAYTLYLNGSWDVAVDNAGNIATTSGDYAVAQNAANACRLFYEDAPLDMTRGIPYFDITLGKKSSVSASVLRSRIKDIVNEIYGVTDVEVAIDYDNEGRIDGGEVQITTLNSKNVTIQI